MDTSRPADLDEYIAGFEDAHTRDFLGRLGAFSRTAAPGAEEGLKWGNPAYSLDTILFAFAGCSKHANFVFTPSTREAFADRLSEFDTGKGSIKLYCDREIATDLACADDRSPHPRVRSRRREVDVRLSSDRA